jgi:mono/diheme cytochrome c family protein
MKKTFLFLMSMVGIGLFFAFAKAPQHLSNLASSDASGSYLYLDTAADYSQDPLKESMARGAEIYTEYCIQCHLGQGEGVATAFPPLAKSSWLLPEMRSNAIKVVKYGQSGEIIVNGETYNSAMANLGLYDDEVADVMNYIMNSWGNSQEGLVTEEEVKEVKSEK